MNKEGNKKSDFKGLTIRKVIKKMRSRYMRYAELVDLLEDLLDELKVSYTLDKSGKLIPKFVPKYAPKKKFTSLKKEVKKKTGPLAFAKALAKSEFSRLTR